MGCGKKLKNRITIWKHWECKILYLDRLRDDEMGEGDTEIKKLYNELKILAKAKAGRFRHISQRMDKVKGLKKVISSRRKETKEEANDVEEGRD